MNNTYYITYNMSANHKPLSVTTDKATHEDLAPPPPPPATTATKCANTYTDLGNSRESADIREPERAPPQDNRKPSPPPSRCAAVETADGCVCSTGRWCDDCYGEYDLFNDL